VYSRILLSIPDDEYDAILPHLQFVDLPMHRSLHESPDGLEYGYFLNMGLASLVIETQDGRSVEVGIVGREGFVGVPLAAGLHLTPYRACVQANGNGLRIKAEVLEVTLSSTPNLRLRLNQYAQAQGMQVAQLAACNRLHEIDQRLARWLLMCHDRIGSDLLPMTHEFFAQMLGTGRPSVSPCCRCFAESGLHSVRPRHDSCRCGHSEPTSPVYVHRGFRHAQTACEDAVFAASLHEQVQDLLIARKDFHLTEIGHDLFPHAGPNGRTWMFIRC